MLVRPVLIEKVAELVAAAGLRPRTLEPEPVPDGPDSIIWLRSLSGGKAGIFVPHDLTGEELLVHAADQFQDFAVEELAFLGRSTAWPDCPRHPDTHPLQAALVDGRAVWVCPRGGEPLGPV